MIHTNYLSVPDVPQNLVATALSPYAIQISWDDVPNEDGYAVERSLDGVNWSYGGGSGPNTPNMIDWNYTPNTVFYYRVAGVNEAGQSDWGNVASARTLVQTPPDQPPTNLQVQGHWGSNFDLMWDDNSDDELDFQVEILNGDGEWEVYGTVGEENYPFYTIALTPNTTTTLRVRAWNPAGASDPSNELTINAPPPATMARRDG